MDWTQASLFELIALNLGVVVILLFVAVVIGGIFYAIGCCVMDRIRRIKRKRKTTEALRCEVCEHNVEDGNFRRCERFGVSITCAPVLVPGCSWGVEVKAVER